MEANFAATLRKVKSPWKNDLTTLKLAVQEPEQAKENVLQVLGALNILLTLFFSTLVEFAMQPAEDEDNPALVFVFNLCIQLATVITCMGSCTTATLFMLFAAEPIPNIHEKLLNTKWLFVVYGAVFVPFMSSATAIACAAFMNQPYWDAVACVASTTCVTLMMMMWTMLMLKHAFPMEFWSANCIFFFLCFSCQLW